MSRWPGLLLAAAVLGLLWYRLIDHLRVEWSVNPQYTYGWAVPFLCAWLLYRRLTAARSPRSDAPNAPHAPPAPTLLALAALLYAPIRLVQEANPEWRLVSWALALDVIFITLLLFPTLDALTLPRYSRSHASTLPRSSRSYAPTLFFLVAVPWPTLVEGPLIQALTRANAGATVELLGWLGVPALRHGNLIEVGSGVVGIDQACSGIRSFQATLMLSLFFGEFYRLSAFRRLSLCLGGLGLALVFNLARTTLLTWVAARRGPAALAAWHDPAGVAILLAGFVCLWLLALRLRNSRAAPRALHASTLPRSYAPTLLTLFTWLLLVELGTEAWYRWHERQLPPPTTWNIDLPRDNPSLRELALSERARQFLRYDEAINAAWEDAAGRRWQAIFLRWQPGRTAVHLAQGHTPEVCLTAAGNELVAQSDLRFLSVNVAQTSESAVPQVSNLLQPRAGNVASADWKSAIRQTRRSALRASPLQLPYRLYTFKTDAGRLHVFYSLWRDRAPGQGFGTDSLTYRNRLLSVLNGARLTGQRSLELALFGCPDEFEAEAALCRQVRTLIR